MLCSKHRPILCTGYDNYVTWIEDRHVFTLQMMQRHLHTIPSKAKSLAESFPAELQDGSEVTRLHGNQEVHRIEFPLSAVWQNSCFWDLPPWGLWRKEGRGWYPAPGGLSVLQSRESLWVGTWGAFCWGARPAGVFLSKYPSVSHAAELPPVVKGGQQVSRPDRTRWDNRSPISPELWRNLSSR